MFHVVLYQPEIPPNTGNIIRLCANTGARLHLIHPLGFDLDHAKLKRAGLDYHDLARVEQHANMQAFVDKHTPGRIFACTTRGNQLYSEPSFEPDDALLFGPETRGLPQEMLDQLNRDQVLRIPMIDGNRSLNLSNAVAIILYEAWRQQGFVTGK